MIDQNNIISDLKGFDWLEPYGHQRLIPTFKGWHQGLQRQVIVRLLSSSAEVKDSIQRRLLETLTYQVIQFRHPGIVKWFKLEEVSLRNVRFYCLINEWFSDESLKDWLAQYGPLNEENVLLTAEHVVTGLTHYWNRCHIAHGNLKPENILIDKEGNLKIDKFGLTALLTLTALKGEEVSIGTPAFMAPELMTGDAQPNNLSDIYALGITLFCLLTGTSESNAHPNLPGIASLSPEMKKITARMVAARPEDRFPSWEDVHEAIGRYGQSHAIKSDQNKKTQMIKIPMCEKNITGIIGAANGPDSPRASKGDEVSKISTHIIPVTTGKTPKLKTPISVPSLKTDENRIGQLKKMGVITAVAALTLIALIETAYLKGFDFLKQLRNQMRTTYSEDMVLVKRKEWNSLTSDVEKLSKSSQQASAIQTNSFAEGESRAKEKESASRTNMALPLQAHNEASADGKFSRPGTKTEKTATVSAGQSLQSGTTDQEEEEEAQDQPVQQTPPPSLYLSIQPNQSAKQKNLSDRVHQDIPFTTETADAASVTAPESGTEDPKLAALMKRAETGNLETQCELGDYYASIDDKNNAFEWYRRAADRNLPRALCNYGDCLMTGKGTKKDEIEAIEAYKKAAEQHDPLGQCKLADCYLKGQYVPQNLKMAVQLFQSSASNDHAESWYYLGDCALEGTGMNKNPKQAIVYYKKAAELNYSPAYCRLADAYTEGLFGRTNHVMALAMYIKAAEMNNIKAQGKLVTYYLSNLSKGKIATQDQDSTELNRWLRAAVTNTFDEAGDDDKKTLTGLYVIYGDCLMDGIFMRKDSYEAAAWYEKAAKTDDPDALYKYGLCLLNGTGVQKDEMEAYNLFMRATMKNHAKGEWMAGECYLNGNGVNQDNIQAVKWLIKAANQKVPEAQYRMGECCLNGIGVTVNAEDAFLWFLKSAEEGYDPAIEKAVECYQKGIGTKKSMRDAMSWRNKLSKGGKEK